MILLKSQKNELFNTIEKENLSPLQFTFSETDKNVRILYNGSSYFFGIIPRTQSGEYWGTLSPGESSIEEKTRLISWSGILDCFWEWLDYLTREISIEDKWERLEKEFASIHMTKDTDDNNFSITEYEDLKKRMLTLKEGLKRLVFTSEQSKALEFKIDYLVEEAKHQKKDNWKSLFIGTFISIIIQLSISQEQGKEIWDLIRSAFNNYFLL